MLDAARLIGNAEMFPVLQHWAFFNHAGVSPMPRIAGDLLKRYANQSQMQAYIHSGWQADIESLRRLIAKVINARPEEIAFIRSTSEALATIANGIDWQWGDLIVTKAVEYPANVYPWMELVRTRGVRLERIPVQTRPDGVCCVPTEAILQAASDAKCRMVVLSMVDFASGQRHDVERIGAFCRGRNIRFCVDAIQAVGVMPVDVQAMHVDYLTAEAHKWILGPEGVGFFYCRRELIEHTRPLMLGWTNVASASADPRDGLILRTDAGRFEYGTYNIAGLLGMLGALTLIDQVGIEIICARVQTLLDRLNHGVQAKGYTVVSPREGTDRSGILCIRANGHSHDDILRRLKEARAEIAHREGRLRISPHFYNTEAQIDRLVERLPFH